MNVNATEQLLSKLKACNQIEEITNIFGMLSEVERGSSEADA